MVGGSIGRLVEWSVMEGSSRWTGGVIKKTPAICRGPEELGRAARQQHACIHHLPCMAEQEHIERRVEVAWGVMQPPFCNGCSHPARGTFDPTVALGCRHGCGRGRDRTWPGRGRDRGR